MRYEDTEIYKKGLRNKTFGEMLMNPETTITEMAKFAFDNNLGLDVNIFFKAESDTEDNHNDTRADKQSD